MCPDGTGSTDSSRIGSPCQPGYFCPEKTPGPLPPTDAGITLPKDCARNPPANCRPDLPVASDQCQVYTLPVAGPGYTLVKGVTLAPPEQGPCPCALSYQAPPANDNANGSSTSPIVCLARDLNSTSDAQIEYQLTQLLDIGNNPDSRVRVRRVDNDPKQTVKVGDAPRTPTKGVTSVWWITLFRGARENNVTLTGLKVCGVVDIACADENGRLDPTNDKYKWEIESQGVSQGSSFLFADDAIPICCTAECLGPGRDLTYVCGNKPRCFQFFCTLDYRQYICPRGTTSNVGARSIDECFPRWSCLAQDQDVYAKVFGEDKQSSFVIQDLIVSGTCPVVLGDSIKVFPPMGSNVPKGIPRENFQTFTVTKTSYDPPPLLEVEKYGGTVKYYTGVAAVDSELQARRDGFPQRRLDALDLESCTIRTAVDTPSSCYAYNHLVPGLASPLSPNVNTSSGGDIVRSNIVVKRLQDLTPICVPPMTTATVRFNMTGIPGMYFTGAKQNFKLSFYLTRIIDDHSVFAPPETLLPPNLLIQSTNVSLDQPWEFRVYASGVEPVLFRMTVDIMNSKFDTQKIHDYFRNRASIHFSPAFRNSVKKANESVVSGESNSSSIQASNKAEEVLPSPRQTTGDGMRYSNIAFIFREFVSPLRDTSANIRPTNLPTNLLRQDNDGGVLSFLAQPPSQSEPGGSTLTADPTLQAVADPGSYWRSNKQVFACMKSRTEALTALKVRNAIHGHNCVVVIAPPSSPPSPLNPPGPPIPLTPATGSSRTHELI